MQRLVSFIWAIASVTISVVLVALVLCAGSRPMVDTVDLARSPDLLMDPRSALTLLGLSAAALVYLAGVGMKLRETIHDARDSLRELTETDPKRGRTIGRVGRLSLRGVSLIAVEWLLFWLIVLLVRVVLQAAQPTWVADLGITRPTSPWGLAGLDWWSKLHLSWPQSYKATVYLVIVLIVLTLLLFHARQWGSTITAATKWLFHLDRPTPQRGQHLVVISADPATAPSEAALVDDQLARGATVKQFEPVTDARGTRYFVVLLENANRA